ncbi:MAG: Plug domain-containing protein, partial [Parasphingorhabdus sp.]
MATSAAAQSTGTVGFEEDVIIVTGGRTNDVGGVEIPNTPKAKQVLDEEIIRRQRPGQSVNDIINLVPGVSFQNNDPWGSSGGSFTIRGFSDDRISQTLDG